VSKATPKYILVQDRIKEDIRSGRIVDKLPGERTLARELDISYMTVRKAIENLVREGVLYKVPTKGTFVNSSGAGKRVTRNIGFFLDDRVEDSISSPYYSLIFKALEKEAVRNNYNLIYFSDFNDLEPSQGMNKVDGLIIGCFPRLENKIQELKKLLPVVLIGNSSADKSIPSVIIDNFNGIVDSMDYLWSLEHTRIGFITGLQDSDVGKDRLKGYLSALNRFGIAEDKNLIYEGDYSYESGAKGAEYLLSLDSPPTAIACANDSMAIGAIKTIREKGLSVPDDVSVVGFDDISVASQIYPPLTTVAAPIKEIAANSMRVLISLIEGVVPENRHMALSAQLVIRGSCCYVKLDALPSST
jgi:DNA-binding LacI/PurR family transcriptional regulator